MGFKYGFETKNTFYLYISVEVLAASIPTQCSTLIKCSRPLFEAWHYFYKTLNPLAKN